MLEERINKILIVGVFISIFINSFVFFSSPFEFYIGYLVYLILLPVFIFKYGFPRNISILFLFLFIYGIAQVLIGNNTFQFFLKIFIGVMMSYFFYYYVILAFNFDIKRLFNYYLKGCYIVCLIGIFQFISFLLNFKMGYDYRWILNKWGGIEGGNFGIRINSIFGEPTYYAIFISSAVFIAMYDLISKQKFYYNKMQCIVVIISSLLSFSGVGYFGYFVCILLLFVNYGIIRYFLIFIPVFMVVFNVLYKNSIDFRDRYDSTVGIFLSGGDFEIGKTHGSSIVLYNNFHVAIENVKENILGTGLGSHPIAFAKHSLTKNVKQQGFDLNSMDANSMFNRLLSETGILGIAIFFLLIFKFYVQKNQLNQLNQNNTYWIISNSILVMIILCLFRQGHYFLNGFPFFIWIYYYSHKLAKEEDNRFLLGIESKAIAH